MKIIQKNLEIPLRDFLVAPFPHTTSSLARIRIFSIMAAICLIVLLTTHATVSSGMLYRILSYSLASDKVVVRHAEKTERSELQVRQCRCSMASSRENHCAITN
jgi:hypothetical protein